LVVVLPLLPVMPMNVKFKAARFAAASEKI
jgi:hypothetical protein